MILKYLELRLQDMEYFDTINTINLLFESLSEELKDENGLNTLFDAMDYKHLSKLINPCYFDELQKDELHQARSNKRPHKVLIQKTKDANAFNCPWKRSPRPRSYSISRRMI